MKKISEGIYCIKGQDEMIPDSHTYVLGIPGSGDLSIIDPGLTGKGKYKINAMLDGGIDLSSVKRIILTHSHFDHIGCLSEIQKFVPQAELWVHENEAQLLEDGDDKIVYGMEMFKNMCIAQYNIASDAFRFQVDKKLKGGENLNIGDMKWEVLFIPGHSPGSIGLYNKSKKVLIPGDVVYSDYAIGRFDLYGANSSDLKESLFRLAKLEVDILLPGHNQVVMDLPSGYISNTAKQWANYL
ncbi:MAG: MBL fold metallo-hydrolase [Deltaproteobacteria bacterium]|nr:MBL fold metallo-hydrolase [Deltaproteobacteria bacterium]